MKRLAVVFAVALVVACSDGGSPTQEGSTGSSMGGGGPQRVVPAPGQCTVSPGNGSTCASLTVTLSAAHNYHCAWNCEPNTPQTDPITFRFSAPVYGVTIEVSGHFWCKSTDLGTAEFYSQNRVVEVEHPDPPLQADCDFGPTGPDEIAGLIEYHTQYQGGIDSIRIQRAMPDSFVIDSGPLVGAVIQTFSTYGFILYEQRPVTAANCLTGDPLLDQQSVRDVLHALWADSSNASGPKNLRREVPVTFFEDSLTGAVVALRSAPLPTDTPCHGNPAAPGSNPGIPLANGHMHPYAQHGDTLPGNCFPNDPPGKIHMWDDSTFGGVSPGDWATHLGTFPPLPMYIVDSLHVHIVPSNATPNNASSTVRVLRRFNALDLCTIL